MKLLSTTSGRVLVLVLWTALLVGCRPGQTAPAHAPTLTLGPGIEVLSVQPVPIPEDSLGRAYAWTMLHLQDGDVQRVVYVNFDGTVRAQFRMVWAQQEQGK